MNFSDLLDEDGQGTRRCDAWLADNIAGEDVEWDDYWQCYKTGDIIVTEAHPVHVKSFTTGDSIDPIWELSKEYFDGICISNHNGIITVQYTIDSKHEGEWVVITGNDTEQLVIAKALFKAYQKENGITTEEALDKYSDPDKSHPPGEGE